MASSLLLPLGSAFSKSSSTSHRTRCGGKIKLGDVIVRCSSSEQRASKMNQYADGFGLIKRRDVIGLVFGASTLLINNSFGAEGAGLPPEQKPRLCDDACEKELENVW